MAQNALNTCLGAELRLIADNNYSCRVVIIAKQKNSISILSHKITEGTLVEVIESIPKTHPAALCITGKGLIHKNIRLTEDTTPHSAFTTAFPSVDKSALYVQLYAQGSNFLISLIRKQIADELLQRLTQAGLRIYTISLGAAISTNILTQLNSYNNPVIFDGHAFTLTEEKTFLSYQYSVGVNSAFPIKIAQQEFPEQCVVAYSAAFQLALSDKLPFIEAPVESVQKNYEKFSGIHKLKKLGQVFLFTFFALLFLSFILFSYYNGKNETLARMVDARTGDADQLYLMHENIAENEQMLKALKWYGGYNYSLLINEIGKDMPKQLQLTEITINDEKTDPLQEQYLPQIKITGTTTQLAAVNNWIYLLKEKKWVKDVKLLKFIEMPEGDEYLFNIYLQY